jgi:hypothetical protein
MTGGVKAYLTFFHKLSPGKPLQASVKSWKVAALKRGYSQQNSGWRFGPQIHGQALNQRAAKFDAPGDYFWVSALTDFLGRHKLKAQSGLEEECL